MRFRAVPDDATNEKWLARAGHFCFGAVLVGTCRRCCSAGEHPCGPIDRKRCRGRSWSCRSAPKQIALHGARSTRLIVVFPEWGVSRGLGVGRSKHSSSPQHPAPAAPVRPLLPFRHPFSGSLGSVNGRRSRAIARCTSGKYGLLHRAYSERRLIMVLRAPSAHAGQAPAGGLSVRRQRLFGLAR